MSQETPTPPPPPGYTPPPPTPRESAWAAGGTVFAGMMLVFGGALAILEGIVGIRKNSVYVSTRDYVYQFDVTSWGWIHLALGVVAVLVGFGLLAGSAWARWGGILIAGLNLVANFMFLPYQPVWAVVMIAIDIFIIWALATYEPAGHGHGSHGGSHGGRHGTSAPGAGGRL
ncbi:hypothetical protein [Streptomyces sp. NPDC008139]|uniref:DUF7144 family membrane protein n=1 Tax=Streptomyces sp. NPDC008139 TaxID=3364814 RepID=UPI0036E7C8BD